MFHDKLKRDSILENMNGSTHLGSFYKLTNTGSTSRGCFGVGLGELVLGAKIEFCGHKWL